MDVKHLFFGVIGAVVFVLLATNAQTLQTSLVSASELENIKTIETKTFKKNDLTGTYLVKKDKNSKLELRNDGTYYLNINVCENYLLITGKYEIRDSKIILYNANYSYDDLNGNDELTFTILDDKTIKSDESLVCTIQETLFER
jgi:hypothetical protein